MLGSNLRRGLAAGVAAGLVAGMFALLVGEIPLAEAIRLEHAGAEAGASPPVTRTTQQRLLPVATAIVGACLGGLFAVAFTFARRHLRAPDEWQATLRFGAAVWAAVALFPALVYPAAPPGVGDPATVGTRSGFYVVALVAATALAAGLWALATVLRGRMPRVPRQVAVGTLAVLSAGALAVVLPADGGATAVPADLLWSFRLASLGTQTVLWAVLVVTFGWLLQRAADDRAPAGRGRST